MKSGLPVWRNGRRTGLKILIWVGSQRLFASNCVSQKPTIPLILLGLLNFCPFRPMFTGCLRIRVKVGQSRTRLRCLPGWDEEQILISASANSPFLGSVTGRSGWEAVGGRDLGERRRVR